MESRKIRRIFYRDGYRLAHEHLDQELSAYNLKRAIAQLYQAVDDLMGSFLERSAADGQAAECQKGCAWCCYQEVFAVTHEFLYLQDHTLHHLTEKQKEGILERARKKVMLTVNRTLEEQLKVRAACPFLEAGSCLAYEARPMACRIYLSSSVQSCLREHEQPGNEKSNPALYEFPLLAGRMLNEGFVAYLKQVGIQSTELAIEQGYSSMVTMGQTMEDWLSEGTSTG
jgi:Fe-S-cluster containining protein